MWWNKPEDEHLHAPPQTQTQTHAQNTGHWRKCWLIGHRVLVVKYLDIQITSNDIWMRWSRPLPFSLTELCQSMWSQDLSNSQQHKCLIIHPPYVCWASSDSRRRRRSARRCQLLWSSYIPRCCICRRFYEEGLNWKEKAATTCQKSFKCCW